jgi:hypothetical protein
MVLWSLLRTTWKAFLSLSRWISSSLASRTTLRISLPTLFMVSQSLSSNSWKSIPFSRKWRENPRILWNPDIHGTSPPGCFWWCYTNKTSPILWMVRFVLSGWNPYDEFNLH